MFDGDNSDYVLQGHHLVSYAEQRNLAIETFYPVHSSGAATLAEVLDEEPTNLG